MVDPRVVLVADLTTDPVQFDPLYKVIVFVFPEYRSVTSNTGVLGSVAVDTAFKAKTGDVK